MDNLTFMDISHTLWGNFAELPMLYQGLIVGLSALLIILTFVFAYNMIALTFTWTIDIFKMLIDLSKKAMYDLDKMMQKWLGTPSFMPEPKVDVKLTSE